MHRLTSLLVLVLTATACPVEEPTGPGIPASSGGPPVATSEPGPNDPPVIWIAGTIEAVDGSEIAVREGSGPRVRLVRLAESATTFHRLEGDTWRELAPDEVQLVEVGEQACVEALLDAETLLALRVFLGSGCGPT